MGTPRRSLRQNLLRRGAFFMLSSLELDQSTRNAVARLVLSHSWEGYVMLFIAVLCLILWLLGVMTTTTLGGVLHILLVVAVILFLVHIIQGSSVGNA